MVKLKISGSTLIEVLIAMVIIVAVFSIGMVIFNNALNSGVSFKKNQVNNQIYVLQNDVINTGKVNNNMIKIDSVIYKIEIYPANLEGLSILEIEASINEKILEKSQCLFKESDAKN